MRKFTLLTALFALFTSAANADNLIVYNNNSLSTWTSNRDMATVGKEISTDEGNYLQFSTVGTTFNASRYSTIFGEEPWTGKTIPAEGYTISFSFNFQQFGNNSTNAAQRNNEIAVLPVGAKETGAILTDDAPYLFKLTQSNRQGGVLTNKAEFFLLNANQSDSPAGVDSIAIAQDTWYTITLTVVDKSVAYTLSQFGGDVLKTGTKNLAADAENRIGGIQIYQARSAATTRFMKLNIYYWIDGDVAQKPETILGAVLGNDREYKVAFNEGETLHYILPGGEEQTIDYWDTDDGEGNYGTALIRCTQSGTLTTWTTKGDAISEQNNTDVECGWIKLIDPVAEIANVEEGYKKSYKISIDNSQVLLSPSISLSYTINYEDGTDAKGEVSNGSSVTFEKKGTMVITANTTPVEVEGQKIEYYERSNITIQNDVEYTQKEEKSYVYTPTELADLSSNFNQKELGNSGRSQWERVYAMPGSDAAALEGRNLWGLWNGSDTKVCDVYGIKDENLEAMTAPLYVADTEKTGDRNAYTFFPYEGLVYWSTAYGNNHDLHIDPKYISDDPAKPNFYVVHVTTQYDRPDKHAQDTQPGKGDGVYQIHVRNTEAVYTQYRFDNAISKVQVLTYKGFEPKTTGIEAVKTVAPAMSADAPIYNLSGVRVANANQKGIYIQNGKKFVVK